MVFRGGETFLIIRCTSQFHNDKIREIYFYYFALNGPEEILHD